MGHRLLCKHEVLDGPSLNTSSVTTPALGHRGRRMPGTHLPASLAETVSSRFRSKPV